MWRYKSNSNNQTNSRLTKLPIETQRRSLLSGQSQKSHNRAFWFLFIIFGVYLICSKWVFLVMCIHSKIYMLTMGYGTTKLWILYNWNLMCYGTVSYTVQWQFFWQGITLNIHMGISDWEPIMLCGFFFLPGFKL